MLAGTTAPQAPQAPRGSRVQPGTGHSGLTRRSQHGERPTQTCDDEALGDARQCPSSDTEGTSPGGGSPQPPASAPCRPQLPGGRGLPGGGAQSGSASPVGGTVLTGPGAPDGRGHALQTLCSGPVPLLGPTGPQPQPGSPSPGPRDEGLVSGMQHGSVSWTGHEYCPPAARACDRPSPWA